MAKGNGVVDAVVTEGTETAPPARRVEEPIEAEDAVQTIVVQDETATPDEPAGETTVTEVVDSSEIETVSEPERTVSEPEKEESAPETVVAEPELPATEPVVETETADEPVADEPLEDGVYSFDDDDNNGQSNDDEGFTFDDEDDSGNEDDSFVIDTNDDKGKKNNADDFDVDDEYYELDGF